MTSQLKDRLIFLADKYENATFPDADPCQFLHWYYADRDGVANVECAAFIAAMLAFGNRKQFIPKIQEILDRAGESLVSYLQADASNFPHGIQKFYRFYSYDDLHTLFEELAQVLRTYGSLGNAVQKIQEGKAKFCFPIEKKSKEKLVSERSERTFPSLQPAACADASVRLSFATPRERRLKAGKTVQWTVLSESPSSYAAKVVSGGHPRNAPALDLATAISFLFPKSAIVPKGKNSANKRVHMFLRWMVRRNSPVDLGLWTWANPADLLIPLDVHVMEEAMHLGLLPKNSRPTHKTAVELTKILAEVFPGDPVRGDFALFGLGVDKGV